MAKAKPKREKTLAAKREREEKPPQPKPGSKEEEEYEFELPPFDEPAFMRREVNSARASFYTLGIGFAAGLLALALLATGLNWALGWIPILVGMAALGPILRAAGFDEQVTAAKSLIGSYFMLFFTSLGIWIFGANFV